ncbi:hypothetical protein GCM10012275_38390 [Longimycelium tulufanense]|uniref:Uncharacterized protein n=1 Tax=Longimycelium tulufanense TaxID=907463 RepID=A0A8J3FV14_9PSEU|nr:hypothetical protein [Longimycelium tulufanense]GGM64173.1 hypothetical protein GCM10012275_38390 [Longimycelium tulufanense]
MADSSTLRAQRFRRHQRGDHSLCRPQRCPYARRDSTAPPTPPAPPRPEPVRDELGARGRRLWDEVTAAGELPPLQATLLREACRIADRLDRLHAQLDGRDWLQLENAGEDGGPVTVVVDRALAEARQQAAVLKQLVAELRAATTRSTRSSPAVQGEVGGLADLTARIAARRASPAG